MLGDTERVLEALNGARVRYLVVGGVAVVLHGYRRPTADIDLIVHLDPENALRAIQTLESLGYRPRAPVDPKGFADPEIRRSWIREKHVRVFSFWNANPSVPEVDLFVEEPFDFEEAYARAFWAQLERIQVPLLSRPELIEMKRKAGRADDLKDIRALEALDEPEDGFEPPAGGGVAESPPQGWDRGFDGHWQRQARWGLRLTPAERLRWLEDTVESMGRVCGRARPPSSGSGNGSGRTGGLA